MDNPRMYTPAERRQRARLIWQGGRKALAGASTARVDDQLDRIDDAAGERWERHAVAALRLVDRAKDEAAAAKAKERAASREEKRKAREDRRKAEQQLRRAEKAARRYTR